MDLDGRVAVGDASPVERSRHAGRVFLVRVQDVGRRRRNDFEERNVVALHEIMGETTNSCAELLPTVSKFFYRPYSNQKVWVKPTPLRRVAV